MERCQDCNAPTKGSHAFCVACGADLGLVRAVAAAMVVVMSFYLLMTFLCSRSSLEKDSHRLQPRMLHSVGLGCVFCKNLIDLRSEVRYDILRLCAYERVVYW